MVFSAEKNSETQRTVRWGFYDTAAEAQAAAERLYARGGQAAVWEGETTSHSDGRLVSVFDSEHGWMSVERGKPDWWENTTQAARDWLSQNFDKPLPASVWVPVVQAGGVVTSTQWEGQESDGMRLALSREAWEWVRSIVEV